MCLLLLEAGAQPNILRHYDDGHGDTGEMSPLFLAAYYGMNTVCQMLLEKGARIELGFNPLDIEGLSKDIRDILEENVPSRIKTSNVPEAYCKREVIQTDSSPLKRRLTDFTNETSDKIVDVCPDLLKDPDKDDHGFTEFRCEGQQELTFLDGAAIIKSPVSFTFSARLAEKRDLRQIKTKLHVECKVTNKYTRKHMFIKLCTFLRFFLALSWSSKQHSTSQGVQCFL